jgi:hypothetical protein
LSPAFLILSARLITLATKNVFLASSFEMKSLIVLLLLTSVSGALIAQHTNFNTQRNWSLNKKEIVFGIGATQFTGDLGGRDRIGTDYSLVDIDFPSTYINGMIGYRYRFHPYWATSTNLHVGMLRGDDALTNEVIRNSRNLHFRSILVELYQRIECIVYANEKFGARYKLPGHKYFKDKNTQVYLFAGVGAAYFNPKAMYNGSWTALQPLHTEGQGMDEHMVYPLDGDPFMFKPKAPYKRVTLTIPMGIGYRFGLGRMWRIGFEATYVKTFSDYIDDVSTYYYNPSLLGSAEAAYLSNPAVNNTTWFAPGQVRGHKEKDAYYYLNLVVQRNITYRDYANQRRSYQWNRGRYKF